MDSSIDATLKGKYPAKDNLRRIVSHLRSPSSASSSPPPTHLYLEAARTRMNEDNDQEAPFRQRRYFFYVTGCELPDAALVYDIERDWSTLFIPEVDRDSVVWSGLPMLVGEAMEKYDINEVLTTPTLSSHLETAGASAPQTHIHAILSQISLTTPSHLTSTFKHTSLSSPSALKTSIDECRIIKDSYELALIRKANYISCLAHRAAMRATLPASNEAEIEAAFLATCIAKGNKLQAYDSIVASGIGAATLHYIRNDKAIVRDVSVRSDGTAEKKGQERETLNLLLDAGCEEQCYASDITRTFPVNGKFSKESRDIYELVLLMQKKCMAMLKGGIVWDEVHELAHRVAIQGLLDLGIFRGGTVEEIFKARTSVAFLPHGLGHYLGLDTHDTGGHANYEDSDLMFRYLRIRGPVPTGAVVTVEPGVYFCRFILEPYLEDEVHGKFIDKEVLERYWSVGGVRIEDDVLVTEEGCENLTVLESEVEDVERLVMEGKR